MPPWPDHATPFVSFLHRSDRREGFYFSRFFLGLDNFPPTPNPPTSPPTPHSPCPPQPPGPSSPAKAVIRRRRVDLFLPHHVVVDVQVGVPVRRCLAQTFLGAYTVYISFNPLLIKWTTLVFALLPSVGAIIRKG